MLIKGWNTNDELSNIVPGPIDQYYRFWELGPRQYILPSQINDANAISINSQLGTIAA